jgi:hypothetical protein
MRYKAFGLVIESALHLPELSPGPEHQPPDVEIYLGQAPSKLSTPATGDGVLYNVSYDEYRLSIKDIGTYYAYMGRKIIIERCKHTEDQSLRLFLLGSVFGVVLHQRQCGVLHGSAIATPNGAVLFLGSTGAGKSAVAAAFRHRGYKIITDEIAAIEVNGSNRVLIQPAYPLQTLWEDTVLGIGENPAKYVPVRPKLAKYRIPVHDKFHGESININRVYVLSHGNRSPETILVPITGLDKVSALYTHIYLPLLHKQLGHQRTSAKSIFELAQQAVFVDVQNSRDHGAFRRLIDAIEADISYGK